MKITISGTSGSGKSSVAKRLAEKLGLKHYSMGDLQRSLAKERGLSILEWGKLEAADKRYDLMVDEKQEKLAREEEDFVMDSWLAPRFVPDSFKVFLDADVGIRVQRRLRQKREEESFDEFDKAKEDMLERERVNRERWMRYYGYDWTDESNYDLIVDTSKLDIDGIVDRIVQTVRD